MAKYVNHPYMDRFHAGKVKKNLAEMVKLIDSGEADDLEENLQKNEVKSRKDKYEKLTGSKPDEEKKSEAIYVEDVKKDRKLSKKKARKEAKKKAKKKKKEKSVE